jgi:hypothetical protein
MKNGKVLIVGGLGDRRLVHADITAELYDPSTNRWTAAGRLPNSHVNHTATLLKTGQVLVVGGDVDPIAEADLFRSSPVPAGGRPPARTTIVLAATAALLAGLLGLRAAWRRLRPPR